MTSNSQSVGSTRLVPKHWQESAQTPFFLPWLPPSRWCQDGVASGTSKSQNLCDGFCPLQLMKWLLKGLGPWLSNGCSKLRTRLQNLWLLAKSHQPARTGWKASGSKVGSAFSTCQPFELASPWPASKLKKNITFSWLSMSAVSGQNTKISTSWFERQGSQIVPNVKWQQSKSCYRMHGCSEYRFRASAIAFRFLCLVNACINNCLLATPLAFKPPQPQNCTSLQTLQGNNNNWWTIATYLLPQIGSELVKICW